MIPRAPRPDSFSTTGRLARMRPSSVMRGFAGSFRSSGTLRSARSSTRRPATSRSSMVFIVLSYLVAVCCPVAVSRGRSGEPGGDQAGQVGEAAGVAPLVVVPAEDLDLVAVGHGDRGVERAGGGRADDVGRHDRVLGVVQDALERALGGRLERGVDLVLGGV